jgi:hypothetical protein
VGEHRPWSDVVELRRRGEISYTASYTDEDAPPAKRDKARYAPDDHYEASTVIGGELVRPGAGSDDNSAVGLGRGDGGEAVEGTGPAAVPWRPGC